MIIRSQNKKSITTLCEILIVPIRRHVQRKEYMTIGYKIVTYENLELGTYSTEERAIKVLDMIQEAYTQYGTIKDGFGIIHGAFNILKCFQMPSDDEVEV